jgi:hypothetical protein
LSRSVLRTVQTPSFWAEHPVSPNNRKSEMWVSRVTGEAEAPMKRAATETKMVPNCILEVVKWIDVD